MRLPVIVVIVAGTLAPALAGILLGRSIRGKLLIGWAMGAVVSVLGMVISASLDLPTGATVVCAFGLILLLLWGMIRPMRRSTG